MDNNETMSRFGAPNNEYNRKLQQESMNKRVAEVNGSINRLTEAFKNVSAPVTYMMDIIEEAIKACGGPSKVDFLDVTHDMVKVRVSVPIEANLFAFLPENETNPRFHKSVTKLLLNLKQVYGVRWIPNEDRTSCMIVSLKQGGCSCGK